MSDQIERDIKMIVEQVGVPMYDFEGKKILISGACGFLGSWFVAVFEYMNKNMFKEPCTVLAVDSFIAADKKNSIRTIEDEHIHFMQGDIVEYVPPDNIDYIIHAAGIASPIFYRKFPIETIDGMVLGLSNLLKYSVENPVKSFLYFSSSEMYGNPHKDQVPTKETYYGNVSCVGPRSCYDESKRMGEAMCVAYHRIHSIPVKWVRPFNVYGPGMRKTDDRVVPKFMFQALKKESLTVHVPGLQTRTFCYVTDAMIGFFKSMLIGKNGEMYNIGQDQPEVTMYQLVEYMQKLFPESLTVNKIEMPTEYPQDQAQRRCPDITKAKEQLSFNPQISLEKGLNYMFEWCKSIL